MTKLNSQTFFAHGGSWVLVQIPLLVLMIFVPEWTAIAGWRSSVPLQWAGLLLTAAGMFLAALAVGALGRGLTPFPRPPARARFRQRGAYALVRHPIYTGLVLAAIGWSLLWGSAVGIVMALAIGVFFDRKASLEEAWLRRKFKSYRDYQRRVKKLIPWVY
jgi:protein-S-isoprenylcysteine O-methyltransferase Ste14